MARNVLLPHKSRTAFSHNRLQMTAPFRKAGGFLYDEGRSFARSCSLAVLLENAFDELDDKPGREHGIIGKKAEFFTQHGIEMF